MGSINRGLDRCAALLANILDDDDDDSFGKNSTVCEMGSK